MILGCRENFLNLTVQRKEIVNLWAYVPFAAQHAAPITPA